MLGDDVAVLVLHLFHHIGGMEIAAVDTGRLGGDELEGRHGEGLAEGVAGHVDLRAVEGFAVGKDALGLPGEVHTGGLKEAEVLQIVVVGVGPDLVAHADKGRVAGIGRGGGQVLGAVAGVVGAVDGLGDPLHPDTAGAVEGGVLVHHALLQGHGQGENLVGGAGLIGVVEALVAPLQVAQGLQLRRAGLLIRVGLSLLPLLLEGCVIEIAVVVQIVVGEGRKPQKRPGIHVHDDACGPVFRLVLGHHLLHPLLQVVLDVGVDGQHHIVAVLGVVVLLVLVEKGLAVHVLGGDGEARGPLQLLLIQRLGAVGPLVFAVDEADHVGGQGGVGIEPLGVGGEVDAPQGDPVLLPVLRRQGPALGILGDDDVPLLVDLAVDEAADLVGGLLVRLFHQPLILGIGLLHPRQNPVLFEAQNSGQALGYIVLIASLEIGGSVALLLILLFGPLGDVPG